MTYQLRVTDRAGCSFYADSADFQGLLKITHGFVIRAPGPLSFGPVRRPLTDNERLDMEDALSELLEERSGMTSDEAREQESCR